MFVDKDLAVSPVFSARLAEIRSKYFSRNPDLWPVFRHKTVADMLDFRRKIIPPSERVAAYPHAGRLQSGPAADEPVEPGAIDDELLFAASLSKAWENPCCVENVATMPSDPALHGSILGTIANPNLVHREYSEMAEDLEQEVVRRMAVLTGYDPGLATGVFTQGGTFCNMYGYLFGIRKAMPESLHLGLEYGQDYRILNSLGGHYSNITNLSVLGVNIAKKIIRIRVTETNEIDLVDAEEQLSSCFRLGCLVPCIMLTMGTTDTFAVDRVKPVHDLCERLCRRFGVTKKPHIHVDAAVGWPLLFFIDYDFDANPLEINAETLSGLRRNAERFGEIKYADSFTVDFHKWGFVPYTSSLVMVKDKASMQALEHDPENFSYFEKDLEGQGHMHSTIECSRGGAGIFGAYSGLRYLGKNGYRMLIAHGLQNAGYFRHKLSQVPGVHVLTPENQGPSVAFRLYDPAKIGDAAAEFAREFDCDDNDQHVARLERNNAYHREVFRRRGKRYLYSNWVKCATHSSFDELRRWHPIPGEKVVFMHPLCDRSQIDAFIANLHARAS